MARKLFGVLALAALTTSFAFVMPRRAEAMCGCFVPPQPQGPVAGAGIASSTQLYNDASMVVLMREGPRTVISMSNNYKGPAAGFALVVPVPVVLKKEDVKTLPAETFKRLETLTAPKLVEFWEQNPCPMPGPGNIGLDGMKGMGGATAAASPKPAKVEGGEPPPPPVVTVEAKFAVGEYEIVVLGAKESDGLETWLKDNGYKVPAGASAAFAPYIKAQQKFFVAKVDITKVKMDAQGVAVLSPLRFSFESPDFRLPVRLGLLNAKEKQDLVIFTLSRSVRYEVSNYPNVFVPTNVEMVEDTKTKFAETYAALFDEAVTIGKNKGIVTEYAFANAPVAAGDLSLLGGDVIFGDKPKTPMVLTRLHARYDNTTLTDDLVFSVAEAVAGGREKDMGGPFEKGAKPAGTNAFQARYVIRHPWKGALCANPIRNVWGGPPGGGIGGWQPTPALNLGNVKRGKLVIDKQIKGTMPPFQVKPASTILPPLEAIAPPDAGGGGGSSDDASSIDATTPTIEDASFGTPPPMGSSSVAPVARDPRSCGCHVPGRGDVDDSGTDLLVLGLAGSLVGLGRIFGRTKRHGRAR